jgi:hypothetical protein
MITKEPRWRYRYAQSLIDTNKRYSRTTDDAFTIDCFLYLKQMSQNDPAKRAEAAEDYPPVQGAIDIAFNELLAYRVCALILADAPTAQIAEFMGLKEKSLLYYEKLFMDVRDRRNERGYIRMNLIEPVTLAHPTEAAAMRIAYEKGLTALTAFWGVEPLDNEQMFFLQKATESELYKQIYAAVSTLKVTAVNARDYVPLLIQLKSLQANEKLPKNKADIELDKLLASITLSVMPERYDLPAKEESSMQIIMNNIAAIEAERKAEALAALPATEQKRA